MLVYQTDIYGYLLGAVAVSESPLEPGVYLIPAGCIDAVPPDAEDHHVRRWTGSTWEQVPDHRGEIWYRGAEAVTIDYLGDPAAQGLSPTASPPPEPSDDDRAAAAWAEFNAAASSLERRAMRAMLNDGPNQEAAIAAVQSNYAAAVAKRDAALDTIWE